MARPLVEFMRLLWRKFGVFDEFAILSRAITAEEVRTIYDSGKP